MSGKREVQRAARAREKTEIAKQHAALNRKAKSSQARRMNFLLQQSSIFQHFMNRGRSSGIGGSSSTSGPSSVSGSGSSSGSGEEAHASGSCSEGKGKGGGGRGASNGEASLGSPSFLGSPRRQQRATTEVEEDEDELLKEESEELGPVRLTTQPSIITGGTLRDYQLEGELSSQLGAWVAYLARESAGHIWRPVLMGNPQLTRRKTYAQPTQSPYISAL